MDTKIEIKQEDIPSDNVSSQNERELATKNIAMKTSSSTVLLNDDCDMKIKMEIISEVSLQNEGEFLQQDHIRKVEKCNSDHEMDDKIEIKEAYWWLKTETSSVCTETKDEDILPAICPRSCIEAVYGNSGKSLLHSAGKLREDGGLYVEKDNPSFGYSTSSEGEEGCLKDHYSVLKDMPSEQFDYKNAGNTYRKASCLNEKNEVKRPHKCEICEKRFTQLTHLKSHKLIHEGQRPHKCAICGKRFTQLSSLKKHDLIHEGKKPHKCKICEKQFTELSNLKRHNLIHEGKKPYKCAICDKGFTQLSSLKKHDLIHEGKKPHKCAICEKRFTQLATLKRHNLIHEGEKPHKCEICKKRFTLLSYLKRHCLVHAGEKPHRCTICEKKFTHLSSLKTHNLIHEGKNATQVHN